MSKKKVLSNYDFVLGRIHSPSGPHAACGPQVGHPCWVCLLNSEQMQLHPPAVPHNGQQNFSRFFFSQQNILVATSEPGNITLLSFIKQSKEQHNNESLFAPYAQANSVAATFNPVFVSFWRIRKTDWFRNTCLILV